MTDLEGIVQLRGKWIVLENIENKKLAKVLHSRLRKDRFVFEHSEKEPNYSEHSEGYIEDREENEQSCHQPSKATYDKIDPGGHPIQIARELAEKYRTIKLIAETAKTKFQEGQNEELQALLGRLKKAEDNLRLTDPTTVKRSLDLIDRLNKEVYQSLCNDGTPHSWILDDHVYDSSHTLEGKTWDYFSSYAYCDKCKNKIVSLQGMNSVPASRQRIKDPDREIIIFNMDTSKLATHAIKFAKTIAEHYSHIKSNYKSRFSEQTPKMTERLKELFKELEQIEEQMRSPDDIEVQKAVNCIDTINRKIYQSACYDGNHHKWAFVEVNDTCHNLESDYETTFSLSHFCLKCNNIIVILD